MAESEKAQLRQLGEEVATNMPPHPAPQLIVQQFHPSRVQQASLHCQFGLFLVPKKGISLFAESTLLNLFK